MVSTWGLFCPHPTTEHLAISTDILKNYLTYLFLAVLDLCCCAGFSLVATSRGCSLVSVRMLLIAVASVAELILQGAEASVIATHGLSSCCSLA